MIIRKKIVVVSDKVRFGEYRERTSTGMEEGSKEQRMSKLLLCSYSYVVSNSIKCEGTQQYHKCSKLKF